MSGWLLTSSKKGIWVMVHVLENGMQLSSKARRAYGQDCLRNRHLIHEPVSITFNLPVRVLLSGWGTFHNHQLCKQAIENGDEGEGGGSAGSM
ncbi:hypothetical protein Tco_0749376 [Tanacetum coccineum]|uniref:Uncharacterized protein n=1 Tax=Tanacetum coccineum TaxID=301880 RepID=A0ABQ4YZ97_9ASTR